MQIAGVKGGQVRRHRCSLALLLCAGCLLSLGGCGSSSSGAGREALAPPGEPTAKDCGIGPSPQRRSADRDRGGKEQSPPRAGVYSYRTRGRSGVPSEAIRAKDLPPVTQLIVTEPRRYQGMDCFRMQKRYTPHLANTETYVIRGNELFLVGLRIQALERSREVRPVPAVLFATNSGSKWSGSFSGSTSGTYSFTGLGRRLFQLGGKQLKTTGVRSSVSYRGAVNGTQVTTAWVSLSRRMIVTEEVTMKERLGVSQVRMKMRRRLLTLSPERLPTR